MEPKKPETLSLLPIRDIVILPGLTIPVYVSESICQNTIQHALKNDQNLFLSTFQTKDTVKRDSFAFFSEMPAPYDVFNLGTIGQIVHITQLADGRSKVLLRGKERGLIKNIQQTNPFPLVNVVQLPPYPDFEPEDLEKVFQIKQNLNQLIYDKPFLNIEKLHTLEDQTNFDELIQALANFYKFSISEGQEILGCETKDQILKIIEENIKRQDKNQKNLLSGLIPWSNKAEDEFEQEFEQENEVESYKQKILTSKMPLSPLQECEKQLRRLSKMNSESGEANIIRTYLDRMLELPWVIEKPAQIDLKTSQKILDEDHACLKEVKEKILDFLAVQQLNPQAKGPIMCLIGAPGVGKTSIAKSIARALKRNFVRISMGGLRDEAEIRGHRTTYLGACPGRIIQALQKTGTTNTLIVLDEIDKISRDQRGDPSASLLEVLDREQNHSFSDHYINVPYDLSGVFFIANANDLSQIPYPLRDRLECIELSGYSLEEKLTIAKNYIVPKQKQQSGLNDYKIEFPEQTLKEMIERYSHESGVRQLDRSINIIYRRIAKQILMNERETKNTIVIAPEDLPYYLGAKHYQPQAIEKEPAVGLAYGLAYSQIGGSVLRIESHLIEGGEQITMTGNMGQVMQESIKTAICFLKTLPETTSNQKWKQSLHLHIPEGATPKDGPSAGLALVVSLFSALTEKALKEPIAFTGEINSFGQVTAVGGIKDKVLAAIRSNIQKIYIPESNVKELAEFKDLIPSHIVVTGVSHAQEILKDELFKKHIKKKPPLNLVTAENF
jgi:ATP-dependent Lon protease